MTQYRYIIPANTACTIKINSLDNIPLGKTITTTQLIWAIPREVSNCPGPTARETLRRWKQLYGFIPFWVKQNDCYVGILVDPDDVVIQKIK